MPTAFWSSATIQLRNPIPDFPQAGPPSVTEGTTRLTRSIECLGGLPENNSRRARSGCWFRRRSGCRCWFRRRCRRRCRRGGWCWSRSRSRFRRGGHFLFVFLFGFDGVFRAAGNGFGGGGGLVGGALGFRFFAARGECERKCDGGDPEDVFHGLVCLVVFETTDSAASESRAWILAENSPVA